MSRTHLVILANGFPYGTWEPYLATELPYLLGFDSTSLIALAVRQAQRSQVRSTPEGIAVYDVPVLSPARYVAHAARSFFSAPVREELKDLSSRRFLNLSRFADLMFYVSRAELEAAKVDSIMREKIGIHPEDTVVLYCYRSNYLAYIAYILKRRWKRLWVVVRSHRQDLYENVAPSGYLPMRKNLMETADVLLPVSQSGQTYIREHYPTGRAQVRVARLGTEDHGVSALPLADPFRIVTCSAIVPVKRLDLLIDALGALSFPVEWHHFGTGRNEPDVRARARQLPKNIQATFHGFVPNDQVLDAYIRKPFHAFINVSESEGVPVSIMEALSTGTPVLATDAGGTSELVSDGKNGILLPVDVSSSVLANAINRLHALSTHDQERMRACARQSWELSARADSVYSQMCVLLRNVVSAA